MYKVFKDAQTQDEIWDCTLVTTAKKHKRIIVNPIYEWSDTEIWDYIRKNNVDYNELYDMGYKRVGCILCPFARKSERIRDIATFPRYKELYIKAFDKMLKLRKEAGKNDTYGSWTDGEGVFKWWIRIRQSKGK